MFGSISYCRSFVGIILGLASAPLLLASDAFYPPALYLTWQHDPTSTMTVQWLTLDSTEPEVYFRAARSHDWKKAVGESHPLPGSARTVHIVELIGLAARCDYEFCFAPGEKTFSFRTMPKDLGRPVRFIEGGDVFHDRKWMDSMNELAARFDPAFVVFGGDLAYARQREDVPEKMERWDQFFDSWKTKARAPDGRLIPMLVTIGNHEVTGFWGQPPERAAGYYALFPRPGARGYNCLDFGHYLSIFLLDSGITHPIEGAQTSWLKAHLAQRRGVPNVFPVYHIPAYPSARPESGGENGEYSEAIRKYWCPLFESYGVKLAFEHHDHDFKRTFPIRAGQIDPKGVVYLGDGAWGVNLRKPETDHPRWYLARSESVRHFYVVTLFPEGCQAIAVNDRGQIFDELYRRNK